MTEHLIGSTLITMTNTSMTPGCVTLTAQAASPLTSYREAKEAFDRAYWSRVLRESSGVVSRAAELADKTRKEVYDAAKRLGLDINAFRTPPGA